MSGAVIPLRKPPRRRRALTPFTVPHFKEYASRLVYDDRQRRDPEGWQLDYVGDVFLALRVGDAGSENWLVVPEGNGKTTLVAIVALYGCDWAPQPWIPVGASSRDQAKILYTQGKGFVDNTPGLGRRFKCFDGYRSIKPYKDGKPRPGRGIEICPWDPDTNDGVIPFPFFICDELHRHPDMTLWRLWKGKSRKRGAVGVGISTAGEPGEEFEAARDNFRQNARSSRRRYGGTQYKGRRYCMHEYRLEDPTKAMDAKAVARINPLKTNTPDVFAEELDSPTFNIGDWRRLKCNIASRSTLAAISDEEWLGAIDKEYAEIPEGERIDAGLDLGWKHDTTALVPQWRAPEGFYLWDEARVEVPPRDGTTLHPDKVKGLLFDLNERNPIDTLVMDTTDGEDIASWAADELGTTVIDRPQSNDLAVQDYKNVMRGLRTGNLRRVRICPQLTRHAMNALGRRLPRGDTRFDRPSPNRMSAAKQDVRVIDALVAAAMTYTNVQVPEEAPLDLSAYRVRTL